MSEVAIAIPTYNNEQWVRSLQLLPGFSYIASDNASSDQTADCLVERGVQVFRQAENLGRIPNWQATVDRFLGSDATWLKWQFAGDTLYSEGMQEATLALEKYPEVGLVVCLYDFLQPNGQRVASHHFLPDSFMDGPRLLSSEEALGAVVEYGNWFGPPLGQFIHRRALEGHSGFEEQWPWAADMAFSCEIAKKFPVLFLPIKVGAFAIEDRKYFKQHVKSINAEWETLQVKQRALTYLKKNEPLALAALENRFRIKMSQSLLEEGSSEEREALYHLIKRKQLFELIMYKIRRMFLRLFKKGH